MMIKKFLYVILLSTTIIIPQTPETGSLMGKVIDAENKLPLPGVNVFIKDKNTGAATNIDGSYIIEKLPVGSYVIVYSFIGYNSVSIPDIIIRSDRITYRDIELYPSSVEFDSILVSGGFFSNIDNKPVSTTGFTSEEIRRAPGSAGDVSRILFGLPSIAKVNYGKNSLIVRGGSPVENAFYIDNIEISNINHFTTQGSSDGFFGILNIDFIKDVTFSAGGFSSIYGDRLSSVMDITFREGNRNEYDAQVNLNFGGIGAQFEGPFSDKKGSFMVSANKSYLDILMKTFADDYPTPEYYDFQTKVKYDLSEKHKLSFIDVFANDTYDISYEKASFLYFLLYLALFQSVATASQEVFNMFLSKDSKSLFYQITYFVNGKRTKKSTKTTDLEEANIILASFSPEEKQISNTADENKSISLSAFKDEYIKYSQLSKSSSYIKRSIEPAFKFFIEFIGNKPLKEISLKEIDNFIISKYNHSPSSAALYYRTLKAAFNKAIAWEYLEINPLTKIKAPKLAKSLPVFINEEQLQAILSKTDEQYLKDIFTFAF